MKSNLGTGRQQQIQLLRLRCQLERKQLQLQALTIRTDYALVNELGGAATKFKYLPILVAVAAAGALLIHPKSWGTYLRTGVKLWGLWQRFSPLVAPLLALVRGRFSVGDVDKKISLN
jgi:hypothetical protein